MGGVVDIDPAGLDAPSSTFIDELVQAGNSPRDHYGLRTVVSGDAHIALERTENLPGVGFAGSH